MDIFISFNPQYYIVFRKYARQSVHQFSLPGNKQRGPPHTYLHHTRGAHLKTAGSAPQTKRVAGARFPSSFSYWR